MENERKFQWMKKGIYHSSKIVCSYFPSQFSDIPIFFKTLREVFASTNLKILSNNHDNNSNVWH